MKHVRARFHLIALMAATAVLVAGCAGGMAGKAGGLHVWSAGTSVSYESTVGQSTFMEIPGQGEMVTTSTITLDVTIEATATEREFKFTVDDASISSDAAQMGGEIPDVSGLVGLESMIHLDKRGGITEATNLEGNPSIEEQGGVEAFREQLQGFILYLPEGALGPGVEWTREYGFPFTQSGLEMELTSIDKYRCIEATTYEGVPAYKITVSSDAALSGSGEQMGMPLDMALSGTGDGTFYVETGTGRILMAESTGTLSGGISGAGFDIPVEMRMTSTLKQKK